MLELSSEQIAVLERIAKNGFTIVAFPLYASAAGVRRGDCAALLAPVAQNGLRLLGEPCWMIDGNLTVRIRRNDRDLFVWKKQAVEVTPGRIAELAAFRRDLDQLLTPIA